MEQKRKLKKKDRNPLFFKFFAIALFMPALTSLGIEAQDINTWHEMLSVITAIVMNPFLLGSTVMAVVIFLNDEFHKEEESESDKDGE